MKKLLYILLLFPVIGFSQVYQSMPQYGYGPIRRMQFDSVATLPLGLGDLRQSVGFRNIGQVRFNTSDSSLYVWTGFTWAKQAGGGSNVIDGNQLVKSGDTLRMRYQGEGSKAGLFFDPALSSINSGKDNMVTNERAGVIGEELSNPVARSLVVGYLNNTDSSVINDVKFQVSNGINLFEVRGNGDLKISNSSNFGDVLTDVGGGVYRPQPFQGIRTGDDASLRSLHVTGTNGAGNLLLRHQANPSNATGQTSALFADNSGNLAWQNDNLFRTTFVTNHFNANRNIRFQNRSYTVADSADVVLRKLNSDSTGNAGYTTLFQYNKGKDSLRALIPLAGWSTTGNAGTDSSVNFIGTTDNRRFSIRTNNFERIRVLGGVDNTTMVNVQFINGGVPLVSFARVANNGVDIAGGLANTIMLNRSNGGQVGIGTIPVQSAVLEIQSTTRGFLPPRMTTAQRDAISSPATGLMIYNTTTSRVNVYDGASWRALAYE